MSKKFLFPFLMILVMIGTITIVLYFTMTGAEKVIENRYTIVQSETLGRIKGLELSSGASVFYGLPFSLPPVGNYRWRNPRPWTEKLAEKNEFFDATFKRPACPQLCSLPSPDYTCPYEQSEDCLHVTVYTPSSLNQIIDNQYQQLNLEGKSKLAVMVFIHGGAFISGSNSITLYDSRFLAEKGNLIIVNLNYRLGPFGSFYQNGPGEDDITGNFGLWDQVEALRWVQSHISDFGGDPNKVTIFGQSAGGQSVLTHLVNSYSEPLFQRAIAQSGPFGITFKTKEEAQTTANNFVKENGKCNVNEMDCLRSLTMNEILESLDNFSILGQLNTNSLSQVAEPWAFIIDDDIVKEQLYETYLKNNQQKKPLIWGATSDEGMFFVIEITPDPIPDQKTFELILRLIFPDEVVGEIIDHYDYKCTGDDCDWRYPFNDVVTDYMFVCPARYTFLQNRKSLSEDLWWYQFTQAWSFPQFWEEFTECYDLPCHSADLPYIFDLETLTDFRFTEEERKLTNVMGKYWTNFAKTGNPNLGETDQLNDWPRLFKGSTETTVSFNMARLNGKGQTTFDDGLASLCDFWDNVDRYTNDSLAVGLLPYEEIKKKLKGYQKF